MKSRALLLLILLFQLFGLAAAFSADTPTLTWERGRQQTITLGGQTDNKLWKLTLVDAAGVSMPFTRSTPSSTGFYIYSIELATDQAEGRYLITTMGPDLQATTVATVDVIALTDYNPLQDPRRVGAVAVVAFTVLSLFSGAAKPEEQRSDSNNEGGDDLEAEDHSFPGGVDSKLLTSEEVFRDRLSYHRIALVSIFDHARFFTVAQASNHSRLLTRVLGDSSYFQALFGPISILLPIAGCVMGIYTGITSDLTRFLIPSSVGFIAFAIIVGIFDAMSGLITVSAFALCALIQGRVNTLVDLRTLIGLAFIAFAPILAASALRPLRRLKSQWNPWERISDVVIAALLTGWAVKAMIMALDGLSHQRNPIAESADTFGVIAGIAIAFRYILEEFALRFTGSRLAYLSPPMAHQESMQNFARALFIKAAFFVLFMYGFLGFSWQIFLVTAIVILPYYLAKFSSILPNVPKLFQITPSGLPGIVVLSLIGITLNHWVNSMPLLASDKSKTVVVILALPAFVFSLIRLFGRYPEQGDVIWYRRSDHNLLYKVGGTIVFALAVAVTSGAIS